MKQNNTHTHTHKTFWTIGFCVNLVLFNSNSLTSNMVFWAALAVAGFLVMLILFVPMLFYIVYDLLNSLRKKKTPRNIRKAAIIIAYATLFAMIVFVVGAINSQVTHDPFASDILNTLLNLAQQNLPLFVLVIAVLFGYDFIQTQKLSDKIHGVDKKTSNVETKLNGLHSNLIDIKEDIREIRQELFRKKKKSNR